MLDTFNNDLPGTLEADAMSSMIADGNYNYAIVKTALEPEILTNHAKFAKERSTFESGGGVHSIRDDDNDIISWAGLFGRPTYKKSDGKTSIEVSDEPLRAIPSEVPESMMRTSDPRLML